MIKWIPRVELKLTPLNIDHLSLNPNAVDFLKEHTGRVTIQIFENPNPEAVRTVTLFREERTHLTQ
jgi:hypothetical protein